MNENESTNTKQSDIVPVINPIDKDYLDNETFKLWYANTFPYIETDFDAITTYKLLQKIVKFLNQVISNNNQVIDNVNVINGNVDNLNEAFSLLQKYVNEYFDGIQPVQFQIIGHGVYSRTYRITFYNDFYFDFEVHDGEPVTLFVGDTTTGEPGTDANVTITGNPPFQTLHFTIPKGEKGDQGPRGPQGLQGPANVLSVGNVSASNPGSNPQVTIRGTAPNQTIDFVLPRGDQGPQGIQGIQGNPGPANSLSVGSVTASYPGSQPQVTIRGTAPNQTIDFVLPRGNTGLNETILYQAQNVNTGDTIANGSEIQLSDSMRNFDKIIVYYNLGGFKHSFEFIPYNSDVQGYNEKINIVDQFLDPYDLFFYRFYMIFSYDNTAKKLTCVGSGEFTPLISNNDIDYNFSSTNSNAIQKIVGVTLNPDTPNQ